MPSRRCGEDAAAGASMRSRMTVLTYDDVSTALGTTDDRLIADILATGATAEEFAQARVWLENDEAPINAGEALASGPAAQIIGLIEAAEVAGRQDDIAPD